MRRREFVARCPARPIRLDDARQEFRSGLLKECGTTLSEMCHHGVGKRHVWVSVHRGRIDAVMAFTDEQDHLHLEVTSNNFALSPGFLR